MNHRSRGSQGHRWSATYILSPSSQVDRYIQPLEVGRVLHIVLTAPPTAFVRCASCWHTCYWFLFLYDAWGCSVSVCKRTIWERNIPDTSVGTNLIHYFTAVTFSVKFAFFHEKNSHFRVSVNFLEIRDFSWILTLFFCSSSVITCAMHVKCAVLPPEFQ